MGESKSDDALGCLIFIGLAAAFLFFAWPYYLGTWLAVEFGADNPSTARHVTGWVLQGLWLTLLASLLIGSWLVDRRRKAQELQRELTKQRRIADFGSAGARLYREAEAAVSKIAASEAARTGWLGDPADFDFRADLKAIAANLRRAEEIRGVVADASSIRYFTESDERMLSDAKQEVSKLEASVNQRVDLIRQCAQQAHDIDRALQDDRERVVMAKRRAELRKRLGPILYGQRQMPGETPSESADVVTARAAAFHELKALIDRHRLEAEG